MSAPTDLERDAQRYGYELPDNGDIMNNVTTLADCLAQVDADCCPHALDLDECIHCNPDFANAELDTCRACRGATTWHLDGECLACEETS